MRRLLFGLGTGQYLLTTIAIAGFLISVVHLHWQSAFIMALGLAMSSDVIAIVRPGGACRKCISNSGANETVPAG